MMNRKRVLFLLIALIELVLVAYKVLSFERMEDQLIFAPQFQFEGAQLLEDASYYVDETMGSALTASYEYGGLEKGIYEIVVHYKTDASSSRCYVEIEDDSFNPVNCNGITLRGWYEKESFGMYVKEDIDNLIINIDYSGDGKLNFRGIEIRQKNQTLSYEVFWIILYMIIIDVILLAAIRKKEIGISVSVSTKKKLFFAVLTIFLSSYPMFMDYLVNTHDICFHIARIEGICQGLLDGQFPVRLNPASVNQYGYADMIFYGNIFLYIPAIFRMLGFELQTCYQIYVVGINVATYILCYYSFKKIFEDEFVVTVGCILYTLSYYRIIDIYVRGSLGEYTAMAFLPLILCGLYRIYSSDLGEKKSLWLMPVVGFSGVIQSHTLSCILVGIPVIVVCFCVFKKTFKKDVFMELCKVVFMTIATNLFFILPFFDFYRQDLKITTQMGSNIEIQAAFIPQLINMFHNGGGYSGYQILGIQNNMPMGVGIAPILGGIVFFYCVWIKNEKVKFEGVGKVAFFVGISALILASTLIPYDKIESVSVWIGKLFVIQFPWRWIAIATITLVVVTLITVYHLKKHEMLRIYVCVLLCATCITNMYLIDRNLYEEKPWRCYDISDIPVDETIGQGEYLPVTTSAVNLVKDQVIVLNSVELQSIERDYLHMEVICKNESEQVGGIELPQLLYDGYSAVDVATGEEFELSSGDEAMILVEIPAGYSGTIVVEWNEPWYWRVSEVVSLLSIVSMIVCWRKGHVNNIKKTSRN